MRIIAICGNYREQGTTAKVLEAAAAGARDGGATVDILTLRKINFDFCRNCQACWHPAAVDRPLGPCPINDELTPWIERIQAADALILSAPVNFSSLTALFKKFHERCLPLTRLKPLPALVAKLTGMPAIPVPRRPGPPRPMLCISAAGSPAFASRLIYGCVPKQFRAFAETWGGRMPKTLWANGSMIGRASRRDRIFDKARAAGARLVQPHPSAS